MGRDDEEAKSSAFKVVDRRRFDSGGEERAGVASGAAPVVEKPSPVPSPEPKMEQEMPNPQQAEAASVAPEDTAGEPDAGEAGGISFGSFVMSLATQALMQLGAVEPPPGVRVRVDRKVAKQTIDIIEMLRRKTKGNLTPDETRMMEEISHQLRVCFLGVA